MLKTDIPIVYLLQDVPRETDNPSQRHIGRSRHSMAHAYQHIRACLRLYKTASRSVLARAPMSMDATPRNLKRNNSTQMFTLSVLSTTVGFGEPQDWCHLTGYS